MQDMIEVSDKRVALSLLLNICGERYWEFTIKQRLARVKAMIDWLRSRLSHF